ncbi:MAG: TolC family protein [Bacteroidia bacterium]
MNFNYLILLIPFISLPALAQDTLSATDAVKLALENNYNIRIQKNAEAIAENNVSLGNAGFLPEVVADAEAGASVQNTQQEFINGETNNRENARSSNVNAGIFGTWTLFDGTRMFSSHNMLEALEDLSEFETRFVIENTISEVLETYYQAVAYTRQVAAYEDALEFSKERMRLAEDNLELGSGSRLEMLQAQVDYNTDTTELLRQLEQLRSTKFRLNRLIGRSISTEYEVSREIPYLNNLELQALIDNASAQNPQILAQRKGREIANLNVNILKSGRLPEIDLNAGYLYNRSQSEAGFLLSNQASGFNYGITARINLFNGFNLNRQIQNARIEVENRELQVQQLELQVSEEVFTTWNSYSNNLELARLESENVEVARQNQEIALESFELGNISPIELRIVQLNFLEAENRYIEALYLLKATETELLRLSGQLLQ